MRPKAASPFSLSSSSYVVGQRQHVKSVDGINTISVRFKEPHVKKEPSEDHLIERSLLFHTMISRLDVPTAALPALFNNGNISTGVMVD